MSDDSTIAPGRTTLPETNPATLAGSVTFPTRGRDRYEVIAEHGRGGLGVVKRALDTQLQRPVAIKELLRRGDYLEARFVREALITARLEHPGIVPVHEAGRWPDGTPYYAMKLVSGRPLNQLIAAAAPTERLGLLSHVIAIADAIAYAHDLHIIHRDLKPANVIVGNFGETVVIDWGLAKDLRASDTDELGEGVAAAGDLTAAGSVMGTPAYMAPEQAHGESVDARADVFALGAILFELIVGRPPGADAASAGVLATELTRARAPADLQAIIVKALAWERQDRYPSAAPLADDLRRYDRGARVAVHHYTWRALLARFARRHRLLVGATVAFVALLGLGGALSLRRIRAERDAAVAAQAEATAERNRVIRIHAASALASDPTSAVAWLKRLPGPELETTESRQIALRARALGVATAVLEHGAPVPYIAFTPDGSRLVACGSGALSLWSSDGTPLRRGRGACYSTLPVAADGSRVFVSASPGGLGEWDLDTGESRVIHPSALLAEPIFTASDGRVVAGLADGTAVHGGGAPLAPLRWPGVASPRMLSPDGRWLVAIDTTGGGWLDDLHTGRRERLPGGPPVRQVRFADGDGVVVVLREDGSVVSVALDDPRLSAQPWSASDAIALSASGPVAALTLQSGTVALWDVRARAHLADITHVAAPTVTRLSPDGAWLAIGSSSGGALLYERATAYSVQLLGHRSRITDIRFQPGGDRVATSSADGTVRLWRRPAARHRLLGTVAGAVTRLSMSPDGGQVVAAVEGGGLYRFGLDDGATDQVQVSAENIAGLGYAPGGGRMAARFADLRAAILDATSEQLAPTIDLGGAIRDVAFSPDGGRLAIAAADGSVAIARLDSGGRAVIGRHDDDVTWVRFLDDAVVVSASGGGEVVAWQVRGGGRSTLYRHDGGLRFMAVAPGPRLVTAGADGVLVVWSRAGTTRIPLSGAPRALAISPAGTRWMVADASGEIRAGALAAAGAFVRVRFPSLLTTLCFVDEETAVGASEDGALSIWRGDALAEVHGTDASGTVAVACRGPGGAAREVVAVTRGGKVRVLPVDSNASAGSVRALLDQATAYQLSLQEVP